MLDRTSIYRMVLGLVETNDWALFGEVARKHPEHIPPECVPFCQTIGDTIAELLRSYDFTESVAFRDAMKGKSEPYIAMKRRIESDPVKRGRHRKNLEAALAELQSTPKAYELLPESEHFRLEIIRQAIAGIPTGA